MSPPLQGFQQAVAIYPRSSKVNSLSRCASSKCDENFVTDPNHEPPPPTQPYAPPEEGINVLLFLQYYSQLNLPTRDHILESNTMATQISRTEDLKELRQILNQGIDDLLQELESHGRKPPSLKPIDPQDLLAPPVGEKPRKSIVRVCEKLTTLVQGPIDVCTSTSRVYPSPIICQP